MAAHSLTCLPAPDADQSSEGLSALPGTDLLGLGGASRHGVQHLAWLLLLLVGHMVVHGRRLPLLRRLLRLFVEAFVRGLPLQSSTCPGSLRLLREVR